MSNYQLGLPNPKLPKWVLNTETATQRYWDIYGGNGRMTCKQAICICNWITCRTKLPITLRQAAMRTREEIIAGRAARSKKNKKGQEVIQLSTYRKREQV